MSQKLAKMNKNISNLHTIASKPERLIIGLMSGTSVDGLDIALCKFSGSGQATKLELLQFETVPFDEDYKNEVQSVFSKKLVSLEKLCLLNAWVADQHAAIILQSLAKWGVNPASVDAIASHGQTVYHAPQSLHGYKKFSNATLQIGDGDHFAVKTGILTLSDFRQKHIAAGGEGAPLAVYGDYLLFSKEGENRIMLNIGGIANFTWLPGNGTDTAIFSTDTGPGNTMMDAYIQHHFEAKYFDEDATIARQGVVDEQLLQALKANHFFQLGFPKTTGPELFNQQYLEKAMLATNLEVVNHADIMATLSRFSANTIVDAIKRVTKNIQNVVVYSSGGGMHNPLLMQNIQEQLPGFTFTTTNSLLVNPDAKEAVLFAVLANESIAGGEIKIPGNPFISMGKLSFPQ
jgi:anhydro-N-acetylmuramic acid kinase